MNEIEKIYRQLYENYGPQGWWPLMSVDGVNPTKTGSVQGYHPGDYDYPKTATDRFEICVGAILTQNTQWSNVELALKNLYEIKTMDASGMLAHPPEKLLTAIRPSGYFNQKLKKLLILCEFYLSLNGATPTREQLLSLWGVGPETADSILLYAYNQPTFVVDAYTKRVFSSLKIINADAKYEDIKHCFETALPKDPIIYQEYHALIVEHAKQLFSKKIDR